MGTFGWQTWNSAPFKIERAAGKKPGTVILRFCGPFTVRDAYTVLPPAVLTKILELEPEEGEEPPVKNILDMTACPFIDSSGLGIIVTHYVRCQKKGIKLVAAALTPKVREVFRLTKVDTIIPIATSMELAEGD